MTDGNDISAIENVSGHVHHGEHPHAHSGSDEKGRHCVDSLRETPENIVTIRSYSGLSGDMLLSGFAALNMEKISLDPQSEAGNLWLLKVLAAIFPELASAAKLERAAVHGVQGWRLAVDLPEARKHRHLADIETIINASSMLPIAREKAQACFELLAQCEGEAHGVPAHEAHFHEVGALDSILDICGACELWAILGHPRLICSPLPVADGIVRCAHGILPAPAPATLRLLRGARVKPYEGAPDSGEMVTPTAIALLRALEAEFGKWPEFRIDYTALVYGQRVFADGPNGVIFAMGESGCAAR